ncbi:hypothetical protein Ahy_A08g040725 [Arachis hypogaea]|uniref:Aminotransferase class I/classII domain-containing protein n=1 Tax=Arachis hypogaea TaxID=3818 RepID=A0A445C060_ARAHY|nr:hypothetical protein Ahy_A08g040725 [Arachis hypogaea]
MVPGWRLGWFVTTDPSGTFKNPKVVERITKYFDLLGGPTTDDHSVNSFFYAITMAAVPRILNQTEESFFKKAIDNLRLNSDICFKEIEEISCMFFPRKPEGP